MSNQWMSLKSLPPIRYGTHYPTFTRISIETTGWCNRSCSFCPARMRDKHTCMTDELYARVLSQLVGFNGVVQWFFCNEPLLDKNHLERIALLRSHAPRCTIHLTTNGQLLQGPPHIVELFDAGVNSLNLNAYEAEHHKTYLKWAVSVQGVKRGPHSWQRIRGEYLSVSDETNPKCQHTWCDSVEVADKNKPGQQRCARPHRHIVVCWDGTVPLCCAVNPSSCERIGDANTQSLEDIWNSKRMFEYRLWLENGQRVHQCANCNESMAFPHVVRRVELD